MENKELPDRAPGKYVPYGRMSYYLPEQLPLEPELTIGSGLQQYIIDAMYELGQLEGISEETDTNPLVYTSLVRREAVESVLIEGADIEFEDLFRSESLEGGEVTKDVQEGVNYEQAVVYGSKAVRQGEEITIELLHDLHERLLDGTRHDGDVLGEFRSKPVHIPPPQSLREPFRPPGPTRVPELMENLEQYVQTGGPYHDLVDIALGHYQFETIHPYGDGNGRLGRLLITLQLIQRGHLSSPSLYLSAYFNEHKMEYVRRLRAVSEEGAWEAWIEFFLDAVREQAADAVARTAELRNLRKGYEREFGHEKTAADRLAMRLFQHPYITATDVADFLDVSDQTARNAISELESQGLLAETTGKERYREYKAVDIFDILTQSLD